MRSIHNGGRRMVARASDTSDEENNQQDDEDGIQHTRYVGPPSTLAVTLAVTLAAANFALFGRLSVMANRTPVIGRWFFVSILAVFAHEMCHFRPDAEGESVRNLYIRYRGYGQ